MAPYKTGLLAMSLLGQTWAQFTTERVWSSFAFVNHGERTPLKGETAPSLTPIGAQQLYSQGSLFRTRYLSDEESEVTTNNPIVGMQKETLDNSQMSIYSTTDDYVVGGATAFMQGLYPPVTNTSASASASDGGALANGSTVEYPLGGYQYPNIRTLSTMDPSSIWIEGNTACAEYAMSSNAFRHEGTSQRLWDSTFDFYQTTFLASFPGVFPASMVSWDYAYELYDYAAYAWEHNATARAVLGVDALERLRALADSQQFALNGNLTASGLEPGDMIRAVAGRTLAARVVAQMSALLASSSGGNPERLTLMFGSFEPMMSFFSLAGLARDDSTTADTFRPIPEPGAAMIFELFSEEEEEEEMTNDNNNNTTTTDQSTIPTPDQLWVRFLYRAGTDTNTDTDTDTNGSTTAAAAPPPLREYPLFGRGNSQTRMPWSDFRAEMGLFSIRDVAGWCRTCGSVTLFCGAVNQNTDGSFPSTSSSTSSSSSSSSSGAHTAVSPAVAGVIGAATTLAVLLLAGAGAWALGGLRISRQPRSSVSGSRLPGGGRRGRHRVSLGGFKGAEKMASDRDLTLVGGSGARHERIGSWELGGGPGPSPAAMAADSSPPLEASVGRRGGDGVGDGDGDSVTGRTPVKPAETV
ncbi:histidine phosphatase superfamily [Xylariomycetidae sp. FL2044]|nr:histidine phosphatase superfamily [Xylariomycetidae sp. FL2044]